MPSAFGFIIFLGIFGGKSIRYQHLTGNHRFLCFRRNCEFNRVRPRAVSTLGGFRLGSENHLGVAASALCTHFQPYPLLWHGSVQFGLQKHPTACQRVHLQSRITWSYLSSCDVLRYDLELICVALNILQPNQFLQKMFVKSLTIASSHYRTLR